VKFSKYRWITGHHNSFSIWWISAPGGDESAGIRSTPSRWVPAAAAVIRCVSGAVMGRDHEKWDLPEAGISKNWCVEDILRWKWWTLMNPPKKRGPGWWILLGNFRCAAWEVETGSWSRVCLPHFFRPAVLVTSIWISVSNSKHHLLSILDFYDTGGKQ